MTDACGNKVKCDLCRYDGEGVGSGSGAVFLSLDHGGEVVYGDVFMTTIATRGTPWTTTGSGEQGVVVPAACPYRFWSRRPGCAGDT